MGFGANVALGWFMMLVAMTFSTELFICATAGLILGHFIFAAPDSKEILGSPCCNAVNGANDKNKVAPQLQQRPLLDGEVVVNFAIEGMTCSSCTTTVSGALRGVTGVTDVSVNLAANRAEVRFTPPATVAQLTDAVDCVGFDARALSDNEVRLG